MKDANELFQEIVEGNTKLLVPKKSPKKIAEAISFILKNKTSKIGKNAKIKIEKEFSAERAAREFERVYNNLI